jgi:hypothetical protein
VEGLAPAVRRCVLPGLFVVCYNLRKLMRGLLMITISTVADVLNELRKRENEILNSQHISHAPTIGAMYEGLTKNILSIGIPGGMDLRVASGFITDGNNQSQQIDAMLVLGDGTPIPHTSEHVYHIDQVLVVFQVKKNLFSGELDSGLSNLVSVNKLSPSHELNDAQMELFEGAFEHITGVGLPYPSELGTLSFHLQMVYRTLLLDLLLPVRVILGYNSFSSEYSLRQSFLDFTEKKMEIQGFSPISLPNLIICGDYSLVKINGAPYLGGPIDDWWPFYASSSANPLRILLEVIISRLSSYGNVEELLGDDMVVEVLKPLLLGRAIKTEQLIGWEVAPFTVSKSLLESIKDDEWQWTPTTLTENEALLVSLLCQLGQLPLHDTTLLADINLEIENFQELVKGLQKKSLIVVDGSKVRLSTVQCVVLRLSNGTFVAGDDHKGHMTRWLAKNLSDTQISASQ